MSNTTAPNKHRLRQECKRIRANIHQDDHRQVSLAICRHIESWQIFQNANTISTYIAMRTEVDLSPLLSRQTQKHWGVPRVSSGGRMQFHTYDPRKLVLHPYGMLEPEPSCPVIVPEEIQLMLVPGLAFDRYGWRLGYGSGFYDRFLTNFEGVSAGITYQDLLFDHIPHKEYDIPMKYLVTENGIKAISAKS